MVKNLSKGLERSKTAFNSFNSFDCFDNPHHSSHYYQERVENKENIFKDSNLKNKIESIIKLGSQKMFINNRKLIL